MDILESIVPVNLVFGMGLFILGVFIRFDATLGMISVIGQSRISLLNKKSSIKDNDKLERRDKKTQLKNIHRLMKTHKEQVIALEDRLKKQKQVIWLAIFGCMFMVLSSFFLMITSYATQLYFLALALILLSLIFFFSAGVFGFQEVGLCNKADQIMVDYLKRRESETYEEDDFPSTSLAQTPAPVRRGGGEDETDSQEEKIPDRKSRDAVLVISEPSESSHPQRRDSISRRLRNSFKAFTAPEKPKPQISSDDSETE